MHLKEVSHGARLLSLLALKCREEIDEPLETLLITVNPEEVYFLKVQSRLLLLGPLVTTPRALPLHLAVSMHDRLQVRMRLNSLVIDSL